MTKAVDVSVNQTRSVMLMLMNEYEDFIIFATNFIENFDPAFMRRISMHVKFELPDKDCRRQLWKMYIPNELPNNIDVEKLAEKYDGISGSDISNAMLNAAFKAARQNANRLDEKIVCEAIESILDSKAANAKTQRNVKVTKREISEKEFNEKTANN